MCPENKDDLLLLAMDALEGEERALLERHLATGCPSCLGQFTEARAIVAHIPLSLPDTEPPVSIRDRLLQRVQRDDRSIVVIKRPWMPMAAAAAIAALLVSSVFMFGIRSLQEKNRELAQENQHLVSVSEFLKNADIQMVSMKGTDAQPKAGVYLLVDKAHGRWMLVGTSLSKIASDKCYELWFISQDGKKIPGGTFQPDDAGHSMLMVNAPANEKVTVAALTDEPAGGKDAPTGNIQAVGKLVN